MGIEKSQHKKIRLKQRFRRILAEWVGFEPTDPKDQQISSLPRYDHFDTTPLDIFTSASG